MFYNWFFHCISTLLSLLLLTFWIGTLNSLTTSTQRWQHTVKLSMFTSSSKNLATMRGVAPAAMEIDEMQAVLWRNETFCFHPAAFHPEVLYMETAKVMNCQTLWKMSLLEQITWINPKISSWTAAFLKNKPNQNQTQTKKQQNQGLLIIQQEFSHLTPVSNLLYSSTVFTKHRLQIFTSNTKS